MNFSAVVRLFLKILILAGSVLLLLSCVYASVWNTEIPFFDLLALILPYLVILIFVLGFFAALFRSKLFLFPLISLCIWFFTLGPYIVFSLKKSEITGQNISVLSYNLHALKGNYMAPYSDIDTKVMDFVTQQDPDILCFQEYKTTKLTRASLKKYPYEFRYYFKAMNRYSPMAIYSKFPIISSGSLDFPLTSNNSIYADLLVEGDTLRVYNVHLQSLQFRAGSLKRENPVRLYNRLGNTISKQKEQAERVYQHSRDSPYPTIICGDFNNTQYSKIYRSLKRGMKDSFMEKGHGLGTTLLFKFLPFRIDYILVDPALEITGHQNFDVDYSDHFPVMASFRFPDR